MTQMVRSSFARASWLMNFPVALVAPVWMMVSPGFTATYSSSRRSAVGGLITIVAAVEMGMSCGMRYQWVSWNTPWERHVPWECSMGTTRSPMRILDTRLPTARTTPTPSWPGDAGRAGRRG
jgi:hypothetical protein